jgi:hypothetical protein
VDGEVALFVFVLILLDPTIGVVVFHAMKFQNASRETNGGIASPEEKKREIAPGRQEGKSLNVIRFEELFVFAPVLAINPESAIPCPATVTNNHGPEWQRYPILCIRREDGRRAKRRDVGHRRWWDRRKWFR